MIGKYINKFMADNELLVNEEFCCYGRRGKKKRLGYGYIAPYDKESV